MRKALSLRHRRFSNLLFAVALLWIGLDMGFDIRSGMINRDFRTFIEKKLNSVLVDKDIKLSRIEGGLFSKITVDDFNVYEKEKRSIPILLVDRIIFKYNLLDIVLRRFENLGGVYLISPSLFFVPNDLHNISLPPAASSLGSRLTQSGKPVDVHILNGNIYALGNEPILGNLSGNAKFSGATLTLNNLKGTFLSFIPVFVSGTIENSFTAPTVKLRILSKDKYYTARFAFKSRPNEGEGFIWGNIRFFDRYDLKVKGRIDIAPGEIVQIKDLVIENWFKVNGEFNLANKSSKIVVTPKEGFVKIISSLDPKGLSIYTKLGHIKLFGYDVLSQIDINTSVYKTEDSPFILNGSLKTENLILNYKPFGDIKAKWVLKKDDLFINTLELGNEYRLFGKVGLNKPYNIDLNLAINNANIRDWALFSNYADPSKASGIMDGKFKIQGPMKEPTSKGGFSIRDGNINDLRFNSLTFNLIGKGPILKVSDSRIFKEGGVLYIDGEIDLKKLGKRNIFENVQVTTDQKVIVWEGWDVSKDSSEVKLSRPVGEEFGVNFKTYVNKDNLRMTDEEEKKSEIGVDYKIQKDDNINVRMKQDSAFVGVEHKVKF